MLIWVILFWITFKRRARRKFKTIGFAILGFLKMQDSCILQQVFDFLFFLLYDNIWFLPIFGWIYFYFWFLYTRLRLFHFDLWIFAYFLLITFLHCIRRVTSVSLHSIRYHNNILFFLTLYIWSLYWIVSAFFALSFVKFTHRVNLPDNLFVDFDSFLRIELLLL